MDARIPDRALNDPTLDGLPDPAFRVYVNGLLYSVGQNTDGAIPRRALRLLHPDGAGEDWAALLVERGAWAVDGDDGWRVLLLLDCQTPAREVDRLREQSRDRQRKSRERRSRETESDGGHGLSRVTEQQPSGSESTPREDSTVTVTRDRHALSQQHVTRDRVGEARLGDGEERRGDGELASWPEPLLCSYCDGPMPRVLAELEGWSTHPSCPAA